MFEYLKKIFNKKEDFSQLQDITCVEDILAYETGMPIKKDKTKMTFSSTQDKETLSKIFNEREYYGNRKENVNYYKKNNNNNININFDCDDEERMPSDLVNPQKYCDPQRYCNPYIQTSVFEYSNIFDSDDCLY